MRSGRRRRNGAASANADDQALAVQGGATARRDEHPITTVVRHAPTVHALCTAREHVCQEVRAVNEHVAATCRTLQVVTVEEVERLLADLNPKTFLG